MVDNAYNCPMCGGDMLFGETTYAYHDERGWVLFERVPALICEQCGHEAFEPATSDAIARIVHERPDPTRMETTPVYELHGDNSTTHGFSTTAVRA